MYHTYMDLASYLRDSGKLPAPKGILCQEQYHLQVFYGGASVVP